ncbi:Uncharacterized protein Adt_28272 [Abeliophyllum distichum]|uniref:Uncharacterized protein n=1 Tax=Abeliophyllum distichum TaxID=126358 RepID=A0ABD1RXA6_9LAMI
MSCKGRNSKEILQELSDQAEKTVTRTILLVNEIDDPPMDERLFDQLSTMIADVLAACLTNLTRVITMKCQQNAIEEREKSVHQAALLLGQTEDIISVIRTGPARPVQPKVPTRRCNPDLGEYHRRLERWERQVRESDPDQYRLSIQTARDLVHCARSGVLDELRDVQIYVLADPALKLRAAGARPVLKLRAAGARPVLNLHGSSTSGAETTRGINTQILAGSARGSSAQVRPDLRATVRAGPARSARKPDADLGSARGAASGATSADLGFARALCRTRD